MKRITLFLIIIMMLGPISFAQKKLRIKCTEKHKLINGTKVFIIPPSGFRIHVNSQTFIHDETEASLGAMQSYTSIQSIIEHLSESYFQKKKYNVIECTKYKINAFNAVFYELENEFYDRVTTKFILVLGNKKEYVMIESYCPKEYPLASVALKKSMLTSFYDIDSVLIKKMH